MSIQGLEAEHHAHFFFDQCVDLLLARAAALTHLHNRAKAQQDCETIIEMLQVLPESVYMSISYNHLFLNFVKVCHNTKMPGTTRRIR